MANPNLELLSAIAQAMGSLRERVVFVGGCANRWYRPAFEAAQTATLPSGLQLRHLSSPYFMATKLEAFRDRGNNDVYLSHDLEDIITVVDGREELLTELVGAPAEVRAFVATAMQGILQNSIFSNVLPGIVSQPQRAGLVLQRLQQLASWTNP